MIAALGFVAGFLFAYAAVPQALRTLRAGSHQGTPGSIICAIFAGTICMYAYLYLQHGWDPVLAIVYAIEAFSWGVLFIYWLRSLRGET